MFDWIRSRLRARESGPSALLQRAEQAMREGAPEQARRICLSILNRAPREPHALSLMANIAADLRQVEEGLRWAERAIAADPRAAAPHYCSGRLWDLAGRPERAEASYRRAIGLDPGNAKAHNNLGRVLSLQGRLDEALACYRRALQLDPGQPEANQNYAAMTSDSQAREVAIEGYLRQIQEDPTDARAFNNLANIYIGQGRNEEALANLERAIALDPGHAEAHYSKSLLLLSEGDYAQGWREYEWRWRLDGPLSAPARRFRQPMWDGRDLGGGALLIHGELALGESLQFVRYARIARERCGSVIFECAAPLKSLLQGVEGVGQIALPGETLPPFAAQTPIFGLPRVFGTTLQNIPWGGPYVRADPAKAAQWRQTLDAARFRVGVAWTGNPQNPNNRDRSVSLEILAPLRSVPGVAFYSLQIGAGAAQAAAHAALELVDLTSRLQDFSDTAALVHNLDLVITIDTSVAHLAGAMGVPVWVMLNATPDWRYHLARADNPWYPSMRLYRQAREGEWAPVVEKVTQDLRDLAAA